MRDGELDDILKKAAQSHPDPDPALLDRIAQSIQPTVRPVRPMPSTAKLAGGLLLLSVAIAQIVAALLGLKGALAMNDPQRLAIFPALLILIGSTAAAWASEMIPGSRRRTAPAIMLAAASAILLALFPALFHDSPTEHFVSHGVACLMAGLVTAVPVALAGWWLLRRGFAVNRTSAGLAAGTLAGLAGVTMLELHCPNFQTWHVLVWHTAVVPVSAAAGALFAWLAGRFAAEGG